MEDKIRALDAITKSRVDWHLKNMIYENHRFETEVFSHISNEKYLENRRLIPLFEEVKDFLEKASDVQPVNIPAQATQSAYSAPLQAAPQQAVPSAFGEIPEENTAMTDAFNVFVDQNNLGANPSATPPVEEDDGIDVITENIGEEETFGKEPGLTQDEVDDLLEREEEEDYDNYSITMESGKVLHGEVAHRYKLFIELPLSKSKKNDTLKKGTKNNRSEVLDRICVYTGKILTLEDIIEGSKCAIDMIIPEKNGGRKVNSNLILHNLLTIKRVTGYMGKDLKEVHPEDLAKIRNRVSKSLMTTEKKRLIYSQID